jgi:hypothetical protein
VDGGTGSRRGQSLAYRECSDRDVAGSERPAYEFFRRILDSLTACSEQVASKLGWGVEHGPTFVLYAGQAALLPHRLAGNAP